jgi:hypothetical protein
VIGFLLLLGVALLTIGATERQVAVNDQRAVQALYLAEAAVERARRLVPRHDLNDLLADNLLLGAWVSGTSVGAGAYRAAVANNVTSIDGVAPDPGTVACGATTCDTDRLVVITGTGTVEGAARTIRALVEIPAVLRPAATITMVAPEVEPVFAGESFLVSGFDQTVAGNAGPASPKRAIAVATPEAESALRGALTEGQRARVVGDGATPSIEVVATGPTTESLRRLQRQLAQRADLMLTNPGSIVSSLRRQDGTEQITMITAGPPADQYDGGELAGPAILEGSATGAGILLVTDHLILRGAYRFEGIILVIGDGSRLVVEGDAVLLGSAIIAAGTGATRARLELRDRAQLHFSQEAVQRAGRLLSATLRAWQEVPPAQ